ncbi:unnamed protein product, partial [marine sediment metagenome]
YILYYKNMIDMQTKNSVVSRADIDYSIKLLRAAMRLLIRLDINNAQYIRSVFRTIIKAMMDEGMSGGDILAATEYIINQLEKEESKRKH